VTDFPPPPPPPPAAPYGGGAPTSSGKAVAALVLGILGLVSCGPLAAIPAIIVGRSAQREIDASGGMLTGRSSATVGIVLGWIEVGLMVVGAVVVALVYAFGGSLGLGSA
jgi:hypothetical protein